MTKQEIDNLIQKGEPLKIFRGIRKRSYYVGEIRITEKQYKEAHKRFKDKLDFKPEYGLSTHYYTLKDIYL